MQQLPTALNRGNVCAECFECELRQKKIGQPGYLYGKGGCAERKQKVVEVFDGVLEAAATSFDITRDRRYTIRGTDVVGINAIRNLKYFISFLAFLIQFYKKYLSIKIECACSFFCVMKKKTNLLQRICFGLSIYLEKNQNIFIKLTQLSIRIVKEYLIAHKNG